MFNDFMRVVQDRAAAVFATPNVRVFTTNVDPDALWVTYLAAAPFPMQEHNCNACRHFIKRFGGLVTIAPSGIQTPVMWGLVDGPKEYRAAQDALFLAVTKAKVTGVFCHSESLWGSAGDDTWQHLHVRVTDAWAVNPGANVRIAEFRENHGMLRRALEEFSQGHIDAAVTLLKSDALYRSEKVLGAAEWLQRVKREERNHNQTWLSVATAPPGFCHVRSGMIGTLLEDIKDGLPLDQVTRRFRDKMDPMQYQRPSAPPKAGAIDQAEKLMAGLGLTSDALLRRMARMEEVPMLWTPTAAVPAVRVPTQGIFSALRQAPKEPVSYDAQLPFKKMTVEKFVQTVVPKMTRLQVQLASTVPAIFVTTSVHDTGVKLFHWNHLFSHFVFNHNVSRGSLLGSRDDFRPWTEVEGVTRLPSRWDDPRDLMLHHGDGLILFLRGALCPSIPSSALFPEQMRKEFHPVRSVIEAHSRNVPMRSMEEGTAVGYDVRKGQPMNVFLLATVDGQTSKIHLDRWE